MSDRISGAPHFLGRSTPSGARAPAAFTTSAWSNTVTQAAAGPTVSSWGPAAASFTSSARATTVTPSVLSPAAPVATFSTQDTHLPSARGAEAWTRPEPQCFHALPRPAPTVRHFPQTQSHEPILSDEFDAGMYAAPRAAPVFTRARFTASRAAFAAAAPPPPPPPPLSSFYFAPSPPPSPPCFFAAAAAGAPPPPPPTFRRPIFSARPPFWYQATVGVVKAIWRNLVWVLAFVAFVVFCLARRNDPR